MREHTFPKFFFTGDSAPFGQRDKAVAMLLARSAAA
jgi:hypothetical protein